MKFSVCGRRGKNTENADSQKKALRCIALRIVMWAMRCVLDIFYFPPLVAGLHPFALLCTFDYKKSTLLHCRLPAAIMYPRRVNLAAGYAVGALVRSRAASLAAIQDYRAYISLTSRKTTLLKLFDWILIATTLSERQRQCPRIAWLCNAIV